MKFIILLRMAEKRPRVDSETLNRRMRYLDMTPEYFFEENMNDRDPAGWYQFVGVHRSGQGPPADDVEGGEGLAGFLLRSMVKQDAQLRATAAVLKEGYDGDDDGDDPDEDLSLWRSMHRAKFLAGEDATFDYSSVDNNDAYDDLRQKQLDDEDKYFYGNDEEDDGAA